MRKALLLAAGLGSRIRSVAGDVPKPLMSFAGAPVLAHNLRWLADGGVSEVWINLHYGADQIRAAIGDGARFGLAIHYVYEPELLGTAGALANIGPAVAGPMLVVYGDSLVRCDLAALDEAHRQAEAEVTVALFDRDRHPHTGIAGGRVRLERSSDKRSYGRTEFLGNGHVALIAPLAPAAYGPRRRRVGSGACG